MAATLMTRETRICAAPDQLSSKLGDKLVILNLESGVYFGLDPVGARVWELIQESKTVSEIQGALLAEFDVTADVLEKDLSDLFQQMQDQGLIRIA
jgi:coenzyme PQQ synthesis protein D (PqqD)